MSELPHNNPSSDPRNNGDGPSAPKELIDKHEKVQLAITGMTWASCERHLAGAIAQHPAVVSAEVSFSGGTAIVEYRRGELARTELEAIVRSCGYGIAGEDELLTIQMKGGGRWVQAFIDHVDETKCIGCGACVSSCGQNVYKLVERAGRKVAIVQNGDSCLGDCHCHKACKSGALVCRPRRVG